MSLSGPRFTYEDYTLLPEDKRCEVIGGELLVTPAPTARHQAILADLFLRIGTCVKGHGVGQVLFAPTDVILSEENVVQPDLLYVAKERREIIDPAGGVRGAPDLVVEILSSGTASRGRVLKHKLYSKYGVREYWVVDPVSRSIEVLVQGPGGLDAWRVFSSGSLVTSPLLPGLSVAVGERNTFARCGTRNGQRIKPRPFPPEIGGGIMAAGGGRLEEHPRRYPGTRQRSRRRWRGRD